MDNQHRKIHGYRELNQADIDLMNEVKELGIALEAKLNEVNNRIKEKRFYLAGLRSEGTPDAEAEDCMDEATPERFTALAKTEFQTGLMYLTRAVAQPTFF